MLRSLRFLPGQPFGQHSVRPRAGHHGATGVFEEHRPVTALAAQLLAGAYLRSRVTVSGPEVGHTQRAVAAADHLATDVAAVVALHVRYDGCTGEAMVPARQVRASY